MQCKLCNESFEQVELDFGEVIHIDDEYWHADCYAEYFDEALETPKSLEIMTFWHQGSPWCAE